MFLLAVFVRVALSKDVKKDLHGLPMWFLWLRPIIKAFKLYFCSYNVSFRDLPLL